MVQPKSPCGVGGCISLHVNTTRQWSDSATPPRAVTTAPRLVTTTPPEIDTMRKLIGTIFLLSIVVAWFLGGVFDAQKGGAIAGNRVVQTLQLWFTFDDVADDADD